MFTLSNILKINALSSGLTGLLITVFSKSASSLFGVATQMPFILTGLFLLVFSVFVMYNGLQKPMKPDQVVSIIWLDRLWVLTSVVAVALLYPYISLTGTVIILAIAIWVGLMAYLQNAKLIRV